MELAREAGARTGQQPRYQRRDFGEALAPQKLVVEEPAHVLRRLDPEDPPRSPIDGRGAPGLVERDDTGGNAFEHGFDVAAALFELEISLLKLEVGVLDRLAAPL